MLVCDAFDAGVFRLAMRITRELTRFLTGAMENWGLITGKTMHLLHDAETSGTGGKRMVVATVSHEAA